MKLKRIVKILVVILVLFVVCFLSYQTYEDKRRMNRIEKKLDEIIEEQKKGFTLKEGAELLYGDGRYSRRSIIGGKE